MFYDEVKVTVAAGKGGDGCCSFRRAKYEPEGGPDGGSGGRGGNVYLVGDHNKADLTDYYFKPIWKAENGEPDRGSSSMARVGTIWRCACPLAVPDDRESGEPVPRWLRMGRRS